MDSQFVVEFFKNKTNFCTPSYNKNSFHVPCCIFLSKERICVYLLKNSSLLLFNLFFFASFIDSCPFCGRSDTDIGRGSSVASSRFISFLFHFISLFPRFSLFYFSMIMCFSLFLFDVLLYSFFFLIFTSFGHLFVFPTFLSSLFLTKSFLVLSLLFRSALVLTLFL